MTSSNTIFVSGLFRSGTTLTARMLSAHPAVHVAYQPLFPLFRAAAKAFREFRGLATTPMGAPELIENGEWERLREWLWSYEFPANQVSSLLEELLGELAIDASEKDDFAKDAFRRIEWGTFGKIFNSAARGFRGELEKRGDSAALVGFKEIWCDAFIPALAANGVKCARMIRDPRGIVASRNHGRYLREGAGGVKYPILFIARAWRASAEIATAMENNDNHLALKYEDLVTEPERALKNLCDFLNIEYSAKMMDANEYRDGFGTPWKGNVNTDQHDGINTNGCERWKRELSEDEVFLCEFLCGDAMVKLGYETITDTKDLDRFLALDEDPAAAESWLAEYGHTLSKQTKSEELTRMSREADADGMKYDTRHSL
jgi:hypothetical protein